MNRFLVAFMAIMLIGCNEPVNPFSTNTVYPWKLMVSDPGLDYGRVVTRFKTKEGCMERLNWLKKHNSAGLMNSWLCTNKGAD